MWSVEKFQGKWTNDKENQSLNKFSTMQYVILILILILKAESKLLKSMYMYMYLAKKKNGIITDNVYILQWCLSNIISVIYRDMNYNTWRAMKGAVTPRLISWPMVSWVVLPQTSRSSWTLTTTSGSGWSPMMGTRGPGARSTTLCPQVLCTDCLLDVFKSSLTVNILHLAVYSI